jgi:hypothetical protein
MKHNLEDKCLIKREFDNENQIFKRIIRLHRDDAVCKECSGYDKSKICYMVERKDKIIGRYD